MKDHDGYDTTPKLLALLDRHSKGDDVLDQIATYAKRGYRGAEDALIAAAEKGREEAPALLSHVLAAGNHMDEWQTSRAIVASDLEPKLKQGLLEQKANNGSAAALKALKKLSPLPDIHLDNMGLLVEKAFLIKIGGKEALWAQEQIRSDLGALETELRTEGASPLEQLLIRRIVLCYLALHVFELIYTEAMKQHISPKANEQMLRRIDQAHSRYLASIKSLAQVRRLRIPALQVNIGEKQINVAT